MSIVHMGIIELFLVALGLSMDAFAVQLSNGMSFKPFGRKQAVQAAFAFGLFQALMPVIGCLAGRTFSDAISGFDHWIALILLGLIGGKMAVDGIRELRSKEDEVCEKSFTLKVLALQAVATSIDALAVGVGFAVMQVNIVVAAGFIGTVTFICSIIGALLGRRFGTALGKRAEIFGGVILVAIGLKIFLEHMLGG